MQQALDARWSADECHILAAAKMWRGYPKGDILQALDARWSADERRIGANYITEAGSRKAKNGDEIGRAHV